MHALGRLIHAHMPADRWPNYAEISRRAGGVISRATISQWASPEAESLEEIPQTKSLTALAQALNLPVQQVLLAAGEAAGMDIRDPLDSEFARILPEDVDDLTPEVKNKLMSLIWALVTDENTAKDRNIP